MNIEKVTEKTTKYKSPDGKLHDTAEAAEAWNLSIIITNAPGGTGFDPNELATFLISNKPVFGPLLHVPKKRAPKAPKPDAPNKPAKTAKK